MSQSRDFNEKKNCKDGGTICQAHEEVKNRSGFLSSVGTGSVSRKSAWLCVGFDRLQSSNGQIFSVADFLDLGPRPTVDQALSRLARQGKINRVRRGLYELPRTGKLLNRPMTQSPDPLAGAWAHSQRSRRPQNRALRRNTVGESLQSASNLLHEEFRELIQWSQGPR